MSISAAIVVYNEEKRIEATLKCASWCDEIIVIDRNSSDRTREIAKKFTDKIFIINNQEFNPKDNDVWLKQVSCEWVLGLTASDLIHPYLAKQLREMTDDINFPYDVIEIPFRRYVLGLETPRSPWYSTLNPNIVFRKSIVQIKNDVHGAIDFATNRKYKMPNSKEYCMYHLTHSSVNQMMERHLNYCRAEGKLFSPDLPLKKGINSIIRSIYDVTIKRKTFLMGWDGIALSLAYITYSMIRFVYIWEQRRSKAPEIYKKIQENITNAWNKSEKE